MGCCPCPCCPCCPPCDCCAPAAWRCGDGSGVPRLLPPLPPGAVCEGGSAIGSSPSPCVANHFSKSPCKLGPGPGSGSGLGLGLGCEGWGL
eukprot:scaffold116599_cov64-Phaeocystis_antarctica.AAC.1